MSVQCLLTNLAVEDEWTGKSGDVYPKSDDVSLSLCLPASVPD